MTTEDVKQQILDGGLTLVSEDRLPNGKGTQLRFETGQIVNVFDTGTIDVQGKNADGVRKLLSLGKKSGTSGPFPKAKAEAPEKKRVFVVYGHDAQARTELEAMLRRWDLEPLILDQLPSEGQTIIEKLERAVEKVGFGVVLATPDDEGHRRDHPDESALRARQNVVLELGMLLTRLGRSRVAIIIKDQVTMERPSDIHGLIYIAYKDNLAKEVGVTLAKEMCAAGYPIDVSKL